MAAGDEPPADGPIPGVQLARLGYPVLPFPRHVLDTATDYADALAMVRSERLMSGGIVTVVGTRNHERAVVERSPTRASVRTAAGDEPLMAINHFRDLAEPEACPRYEYVMQYAGKQPGTDTKLQSSVAISWCGSLRQRPADP